MVALALLFLQTADYSAEGMKALEEHRYEAAVQSFNKAIEADPKDYAAHFNLALAYGFLHKDAEGIAEYRKTLDLKPGLYEAELNAAILLLRQKNPTDAVALADQAASQRPREFRPRYYLAEAQLQLGALAQAAKNFRMALELDPKSAPAELGLGRALARLEKLEEAAPHFRQAAQLDAAYRDHLLELAELYENHRQAAEAIAIYRDFADNAAAQEHLGALLLETKQYADAIPSLQQAYDKDPTTANSMALAMGYLFSKQTEKALPLIEKAAAAEPQSYDIRMAYARALRDSKQYPAAAREFNQAAKLKPNDVAAWSEMAAMLYMAGDLTQSLAAFERAMQLGEDTAGNAFLRAIILDKLKEAKPALAKPALEAYQHFLAMSHGEHPDQEFQARQRVRIIQKEMEKR